jgi:hypothetical protein
MLGALPQYCWCGIELSRYSGFICHGYKVLLIAAVGALEEVKKEACCLPVVIAVLIIRCLWDVDLYPINRMQFSSWIRTLVSRNHGYTIETLILDYL